MADLKGYGGVRVEVGQAVLPPGVFLLVGDGDAGAMVGMVVDTLTREQLYKVRDTAIATVNAAISRARG